MDRAVNPTLSMGERERNRTESDAVDVELPLGERRVEDGDALVENRGTAGFDSAAGGSIGDQSKSQARTESASRFPSLLEGVVSTRSVGIAFLLVIVGGLSFGALPLLGFPGKLVGIATAGFVYGLGTDSRRYVELGLAGAIVGAGFLLLGNVVFTILGSGLPLLMAGALSGAIAGAVGHYFGRDLRRGLTGEIPEEYA